MTIAEPTTRTCYANRFKMRAKEPKSYFRRCTRRIYTSDPFVSVTGSFSMPAIWMRSTIYKFAVKVLDNDQRRQRSTVYFRRESILTRTVFPVTLPRTGRRRSKWNDI